MKKTIAKKGIIEYNQFCLICVEARGCPKKRFMERFPGEFSRSMSELRMGDDLIADKPGDRSHELSGIPDFVIFLKSPEISKRSQNSGFLFGRVMKHPEECSGFRPI